MKNLTQRIQYIKQRNDLAKKEPDRATYPIRNWRGTKALNLKIIEVDVDYLMYRMENSRTEIQQMAFLRNNPLLPADLFKDPESAKAQEAQESILGIINKAAGKDFFVDLRTRGQEEPAIITFDGYLINGNRRTAALKSLDVRYIDCVVLPEDTTPKDIYELEQSLQISQDFREPYHWINELKNIRRGLEDSRYNFSENEMAKRLKIDIKDLKAKRRMLELLDAFLLWKGIQGQYDYSKLEDTEQTFIQLEKATKKYKDQAKFSELRNAVFTLIEEKPSKGRLYNYVGDLIKHFDQIYDTLHTPQQPLEPSNQEPEETETTILDELLEGEAEQPQSIFSDSDNAEELASTLVEKIADVKAANKEKTSNEAVYEAVSSSLRELNGLSIDQDTTKLDSIRSKLIEIVRVSNSLLDQLKDYED